MAVQCDNSHLKEENISLPNLPEKPDDTKARMLSAVTLAFVGDAVFELMVRTKLACEGTRPAGSLHTLAIKHVSASAQSKAVERLIPQLTEEETAVYKRGRNANSVTRPKNTSFSEYRRATGFECLFGYLYLCGRTERLEELFALMVENDTPKEE